MKSRRFMRFAVPACALALVIGTVARRLLAQAPAPTSIGPEVRERAIGIDRGAAALWQSLLKLHTRASMIMIDAHPDDEDGGLMAYDPAARAPVSPCSLSTAAKGART